MLHLVELPTNQTGVATISDNLHHCVVTCAVTHDKSSLCFLLGPDLGIGAKPLGVDIDYKGDEQD